MNVIHMKKPGVYKRPAQALEPGKPFRMRDPKTCEWATFMPVLVPPAIGMCSKCAFCTHNGDVCTVRWDPKPMEDNSLFIQFAGLCIQHIKGYSFMKRYSAGSVVFKNIDDIMENL